MERAHSLGSTKVWLLPPVGNVTEGFLDVSVRKAGGDINEDKQLIECFSSNSYEEGWGGMGWGKVC